jgi:two-component system, LuxR family, sensor kinase FixL
MEAITSVTPLAKEHSLELARPLWLQPSSVLRQAAAAAGVLIAYVALEWISFIHEYKNVPITPWNPGLGVVFALMVLGGPRSAAVLFAGVVIAEITVLQTNLQWPIVLAIAAIFATVYGTTAAVARKYVRLDASLHHLRDVIVLLAAGVSGAVLAAILLSALLLANRQLEWADVVVASVPLLVGDVIGIAVVTPLLLRVFRQGRESLIAYSRARVPEVVLYVMLIAASLWVIVGPGIDGGSKFFYLLFVPVVVAAVRYGFDGACIALAITQLGLVGVLHLFGTDARAFTEFQTLMLVLTATGLIVGAVVSERQNADLLVREAEARLREKEAEAAQAARFSLVSGMASALAHEINQPMTAARALARSAQHILGMPEPDLPRAATNLTTLIAHIDHAGGVVGHMRDFLRRGRPHVSTVDLHSLLDDTLSLAHVEAGAHAIAIELDAAGDLPPVYGDRVQLQQVILNFVHNAIEAITGARQANGRVRISAARFDAPPRVEIGVCDNGPGIRKELADRLFAPLTTSKSEGLGLGLSICAAIVDSHGGRVWLHSGEAGATEFRFSLPLTPAQA